MLLSTFCKYLLGRLHLYSSVVQKLKSTFYKLSLDRLSNFQTIILARTKDKNFSILSPPMKKSKALNFYFLKRCLSMLLKLVSWQKSVKVKNTYIKSSPLVYSVRLKVLRILLRHFQKTLLTSSSLNYGTLERVEPKKKKNR